MSPLDSPALLEDQGHRETGQTEALLLLVCPWSVPHVLECWALAQGVSGALARPFRGGAYLKKVSHWGMSDPQG